MRAAVLGLREDMPSFLHSLLLCLFGTGRAKVQVQAYVAPRPLTA